MITNFKIFENQKQPLEIGDYVRVYGDYFDSEMINFFKTHIGKIMNIEDKESEYPYDIEFEEEIPTHRSKYMNFTEDEIVEWNKDKYFFIMQDAANKYNL